MTLAGLLEGFHFTSAAANDTEATRRLILRLAVRGRLVPQDPDEEPAAELIKRIRDGSDRDLAKGKLRGSGPLPPIEPDEVPFALPVGWAWVRVGTLADVVRGVSYHKSQASLTPKNGLVPILRAHNIDGEVNLENLVYVPREDVGDEQYVREGDMLIAMSSGSKSLVGKAAQAQHNLDAGFGAFCGVVRFLAGTSRGYQNLFFQSPDYRQRISSVGKGIGINNLRKSDLLLAILPLPPLAEQKRVEAKVAELTRRCDELDRLVDERNARRPALVASCLNALTTAPRPSVTDASRRLTKDFELLMDTPESVAGLRRAILQLAVHGELVPQDPDDESASELLKRIKVQKEGLVEAGKIKKPKPLPPIVDGTIPYEVPAGWTWAHFLDVANIASNLVAPAGFLDLPHIAPDSIEKNTGRLLDYRTVGEDRVRSGNHLFFPGQIIYSKIRPNLNKLTVVDFEGLCSADMYPIDSYIHASFLAWFMLSSEFLRQSVRHDTRVAMPKINQDQLGRILVPVPPLPEQKRVAAKADELTKLCDALATKLAKARADADTLLSSFVFHLGNQDASLREEVSA